MINPVLHLFKIALIKFKTPLSEKSAAGFLNHMGMSL